MIDSIFKRVSSSTLDALKQSAANSVVDVNVDELTNALSSVKGDLKVAHSGLQKIYEEANYVYARLDHMEQSISTKATTAEAKKESDEGENSGESGSSGGVVIEKHLFVGEGHSEEKLSKIQEAKMLTKELLSSIETLSERVKQSSTLTNTSPTMRL